MAQTTLTPQAEIRRFDIFAEWNRLKARQRSHLPEAEAQAYGLAVAKVVAARKFTGYRPAAIPGCGKKLEKWGWGREGFCALLACVHAPPQESDVRSNCRSLGHNVR
jgi:hypothetical protein